MGEGGGSRGPSPRCFESLISFLFRGVILRTWCHQRVEGQGVHFIPSSVVHLGLLALAALRAGGSQAQRGPPPPRRDPALLS